MLQHPREALEIKRQTKNGINQIPMRHQAQHIKHTRRFKKFHQFRADAFAREFGKTVAFLINRDEGGFISIAFGEARGETEETQGAKIVFAYAPDWVTDKAHMAGIDVINTANGIGDES